MTVGNEKKVETLKKAAQQKRQDALERTNRAIAILIRKSQAITFAAVAQEAGVSTAYLYKYAEIKDRINQLKSQQNGSLKRSKPQPASDKSKLVIINALKERVKKLEEQNTRLTEQNKVVYGRLCQLESIQQEAEALRRQNSSLTSENGWLKQQLEQGSTFLLDRVPVSTSKAPLLSQTQSVIDITPAVREALAKLNLQLNPTLIRAIQSASEATVLAAIDALKEALETGEIQRPGGWLKRAIEESWIINEQVNCQSETVNSNLFNQWFELAREQGLVIASMRGDDGQMYVFDHDGVRYPFEQIVSKYPLEKLKESVR
jgi:hypothetical protein